MQRDSVGRNGFSLLEMMIVLCIAAVVMMAVAPGLIRTAQVNNEQAAAAQIQAIGTAEAEYFNTYHVFVPHTNLVGNPDPAANPAYGTCLNPAGLLLQGSQTMAPAGYMPISWTGQGAANTAVCPGVNGYTGFQIIFEPKSRSVAQRWFRYSSTDSKVYSSPDGSTWTAYQTPVQGGTGGNGGSTTPPATGANSWGGIWSSSSVVTTGQEYLRPASISGDSCTFGGGWFSMVNGINVVGPVFISKDGVANDPCQNPSDWYFTGSGLTYNPAPPPPPQCGNPQGNIISGVFIPSQGTPNGQTNLFNNVCGTYHLMTLSISPDPNSGSDPDAEFKIANMTDTQNGGTGLACSINAGQSSWICTDNGPADGDSLTIDKGDQVALLYSYSGTPARNKQGFTTTVNWSIQ